MAMAARRMGCAVSVIDPTPDCPAGQVADQQIVAAFDDQQAMRSLVESCDVTTFEIETIDVTDLIEMENAGHAIYPSPALLARLQDKLLQKQFLADAGLPTAVFVDAGALNPDTFAEFGYPLVQKARRGGYDGRGVAVLKSADEFDRHLPVPSYIERCVQAEKELSVLVARCRNGHCRCYSVVEMRVHAEQNVLDTLISPAHVSEEVAVAAETIARQAVEMMEGVGIFGVEMFLTAHGDILINEIAPRPHNSGHYTIDACVTSQFEQQVRTLCGLPLGSTSLHSAAVMVNILGDLWQQKEPDWHQVLENPYAKLHLYGKREALPGRKMGHYTVLDASAESALRQALNIKRILNQNLNVSS